MKNCIDEGTLQTWFDGELTATEAAAVKAHVTACARCAQAARELETENSLLSQALSLEFSAAVPTERLRQRVDAAVAGLQSVRTRETNKSSWQSLVEFFASFRPLAYASVAVIVLLAGVLTFVYLKRQKPTDVIAEQPTPKAVRTSPGPSPEPSPQLVVKGSDNVRTPPPRQRSRRTYTAGKMDALAKQESQYQREIARLSEHFQSQPPLRPSLRVEYEHNLALIDNAIAYTRTAAKKNPKDPQAAQFVLAAYQSKVDLMNQFADLRGLEKLEK